MKFIIATFITMLGFAYSQEWIYSVNPYYYHPYPRYYYPYPYPAIVVIGPSERIVIEKPSERIVIEKPKEEKFWKTVSTHSYGSFYEHLKFGTLIFAYEGHHYIYHSDLDLEKGSKKSRASIKISERDLYFDQRYLHCLTPFEFSFKKDETLQNGTLATFVTDSISQYIREKKRENTSRYLLLVNLVKTRDDDSFFIPAAREAKKLLTRQKNKILDDLKRRHHEFSSTIKINKINETTCTYFASNVDDEWIVLDTAIHLDNLNTLENEDVVIEEEPPAVPARQ